MLTFFLLGINMLLLYRQESILAVSHLPQTQKGEVKGRSLLAVSAGNVGTAAVEAGKERPARGVQKPPSPGLGENGSRTFSQPPGVMV